MPVIQITQKHLDEAKKVDDGFHLVKLLEVTEEPNSKKTGSNFFFQFQVISEGSNQNRYLRHLVSDKQIGRGLVPVVCALEDVEPDSFEPSEIDTDKLVNKTCIIEVEGEEWQNQIQPRIQNFMPASCTDIDLVK